MTEGKTHEAKFYISRILSALEPKVEHLMEVMQSNSGSKGKGSGNEKGETSITNPTHKNKNTNTHSNTNTNSNTNTAKKNTYSKWNRKRSRVREHAKTRAQADAKKNRDRDSSTNGGNINSNNGNSNDHNDHNSNDDDDLPYAERVEHWELQQWLEELLIRVFHGDYLATGASLNHENEEDVYPYPQLESDSINTGNSGGNGGYGGGSIATTNRKTFNILETFQMFSNLYDWLADGEMTGRFVFDIGQSLYESGKSELGHAMMRRGHLTANPVVEGVVSVEVVKIRLALDYPVVPSSTTQLVESYLNMTEYLSRSSLSYKPINIENVMDIYWPVPLLPFSGLCPGPILLELMYRFNGGSMRSDSQSVLWLADTLDLVEMGDVGEVDGVDIDIEHVVDNSNSEEVGGIDTHNSNPTPPPPPPPLPRIEIGIFGGHLNNHPVGHMVLHRLLSLDKTKFRITLVATPLNADHITRDIASKVDEIVNIPMATDKAWAIIESKLHLVSIIGVSM